MRAPAHSDQHTAYRRRGFRAPFLGTMGLRNLHRSTGPGESACVSSAGQWDVSARVWVWVYVGVQAGVYLCSELVAACVVHRGRARGGTVTEGQSVCGRRLGWPRPSTICSDPRARPFQRAGDAGACGVDGWPAERDTRPKRS